MADNSQTEVLVSGAGPVGMLTALLLTRHGLRTRIIDQESFTTTHSYACALHPASLRILERAGIFDDVIRLGRRVETVGLYEGPIRRAQIKFSDLTGPHRFALVLAQSDFEELLERKLREAGVKIEWNRRLFEIKQSTRGVQVGIERLAASGRGYMIPELETTVKDHIHVQADFVVGADGHNSALRRQLGIKTTKAGPAQLFGVYEIETAEALDHEMKLVLNGSGVNVLWPLAENKCRWSFQIVPPEAVADFPQKSRDRSIVVVQPPSEWDSLHHLRRFLTERAPWFEAEVKDILWVTHVQFERQVALHFGEERCWLAGDAAHQAGPAGTQSMNLGLQEGAALADRLKSILHEHSDLELLRSYDRIYRSEWRRLLGLAAPLEQPSDFATWARPYFSTILGSLPASGEDLSILMGKI